MNKNYSPMAVFTEFNQAFANGDFPKVMEMFDANVVWHQPGANKMSGTVTGIANLGQHLGHFMEESLGSFQIRTNWAAENGAFVSANVTVTADKGEKVKLNLDGTDLFRIEDGLIKEVWLFTGNQAMEDAFWG